MKIEILHPISHDGHTYGRGWHDLDNDTAARFLGIRTAPDHSAVAVPYLDSSAVLPGVVQPPLQVGSNDPDDLADELHLLTEAIRKYKSEMRRGPSSEQYAAYERRVQQLTAQRQEVRAKLEKVGAQTTQEPNRASPIPSEPEPPLSRTISSTVEKASRQSESQAISITTTGLAAKWEDIEISFLSEERIQIRNGNQLQTRNYSEAGFEDRRSGRPSLAWLTLRQLAERDGIIQTGEKFGSNGRKIEKRLQEIRKQFRQLFGIPGDPLPRLAGIGTRARFRISLRPSFET